MKLCYSHHIGGNIIQAPTLVESGTWILGIINYNRGINPRYALHVQRVDYYIDLSLSITRIYETYATHKASEVKCAWKGQKKF